MAGRWPARFQTRKQMFKQQLNFGEPGSEFRLHWMNQCEAIVQIAAGLTGRDRLKAWFGSNA